MPKYTKEQRQVIVMYYCGKFFNFMLVGSALASWAAMFIVLNSSTPYYALSSLPHVILANFLAYAESMEINLCKHSELSNHRAFIYYFRYPHHLYRRNKLRLKTIRFLYEYGNKLNGVNDNRLFMASLSTLPLNSLMETVNKVKEDIDNQIELEEKRR